MKKKLAVAAALMAAVVAGPAMAKPWRHGVIEPKSDAGFLMMAFSRDFAKKHGIELEFVSLKNDTLGLRAIISGDLDSYEGGAPVQIWARDSGVKEIGCPWLPVPHAVFARVGINSVADLAGKTMATSAPSSLPDLIGRLAVEQAGLAAGSVKFANVGGDSDRYRSLAGGVVEAAVISSEYTPIMDPTKIHLVRAGAEIAPELVRTCYQATAKTLAERSDDAARFLATEMEALHFALDHKDETVKLTQEITSQKPDDPRAAFMYDEVKRTNAIDPTLPLPVEKLTAMQQSMLKLGVVTKLVDIQTVIDGAPRAKALSMQGQ